MGMDRSDNPFIEYRVFRTVRLKTPRTGGAWFDLAKREDRFSQFDGRTIYTGWTRRRFKENVEPGPVSDLEF